MRDAIGYARVSTDAQAVRGWSLDAQDIALKECAAKCDLRLVREPFVDKRTASKRGRPGFAAMRSYLRAHPNVRDLVVVSLDRLTRNTHDLADLEDLVDIDGVTIHVTSDGSTLHRNSPHSEWTKHGILFAIAGGKRRELRESTRDKMHARWDAGLFSGTPPRGYCYPPRPASKSIRKPTIVPSAEAPIIVRLFERFDSLDCSADELARWLAKHGIVAKNGKPLARGVILSMLRSRVYIGEVLRNGVWRPAMHAPIVGADLWACVQRKLASRGREGFARRGPRGDRPYTGALICDRCGTSIVHYAPRGRHNYHAWQCSSPMCDGRALVNERFIDESMPEALRMIDVPHEHAAASVARVLKAPRDDEKCAAELRRKIGRASSRIDAGTAALLELRADEHEQRADLLAGQRLARDERGLLQAELDALSSGIDAWSRGARVALASADVLRELPTLWEIATTAERAELIGILFQRSGLQRSRWRAEVIGKAPGRGGARIYQGRISPSWRPCWLPFVRARMFLCAPAFPASRTTRVSACSATTRRSSRSASR